jgi:hypothetical protein
VIISAIECWDGSLPHFRWAGDTMSIASKVFLAALVAVGLLARTSPGLAESRIALVIGNGAYQSVPRLANPSNDAKAVAAALRRSGFDTIIATDLDKNGMEDATIRFSRAARSADVALFYYSGHALQFNGINYLAPIDAKLADESDLRRMTRVDEIVADLQQAKSLRILVLDSCRDNPLAEQLRRSIGTTRSVPIGRGLAKIDAPQGMIMAYATQAGRTAEDGDGSNSPYTTAFLRHIEEQNEIGTIFREVTEDVYENTNHSQLPELSLSIIGRFYLRGMSPAASVPANPTPSAPVKTTSADFDAAVGVDTTAGWDAFLREHPEGFYADLARERKAKIEDREKPAKPRTEIAALSPQAETTERAAAADLPRLLQAELRRVGCNTGIVDGNWSAATQTAMELFNRHAGMKLDTRLASADALEVIKSKSGRICPLVCDRGYKSQGETCVKIECGPGSHLSSDNSCERDARGSGRKDTAPDAAATPNRAASRSVEPGGAEGTASAMQRADHAKNQGKYTTCMGALPGCYERAIRNMTPDVARAWCSRKPTC